MNGLGTASGDSLLTSLRQRIEAKLKPDLLADKIRISDYIDMPFAILLYDPSEEFELRHQVQLLGQDLLRHGRYLNQINLTKVMWDCLETVGIDAEALGEVERQQGLERVVETIHSTLSEDPEALLHERVKEQLHSWDPANTIAMLTHAGGLYPVYRTNALLENLTGVQVPTILCYPGELHGAKALSFMGEFEPDPNYRPRIY